MLDSCVYVMCNSLLVVDTLFETGKKYLDTLEMMGEELCLESLVGHLGREMSNIRTNYSQN